MKYVVNIVFGMKTSGLLIGQEQARMNHSELRHSQPTGIPTPPSHVSDSYAANMSPIYVTI